MLLNQLDIITVNMFTVASYSNKQLFKALNGFCFYNLVLVIANINNSIII